MGHTFAFVSCSRKQHSKKILFHKWCSLCRVCASDAPPTNAPVRIHVFGMSSPESGRPRHHDIQVIYDTSQDSVTIRSRAALSRNDLLPII